MTRLAKILTVALFVALTAVNIIIVIIFREQATISKLSILPIIWILLILYYGITACFFKHKGNLFYVARSYLFWGEEDKAYTFTREYLMEFYLMLTILWATIPFYIPLIFLVSDIVTMLMWLLIIFFVPEFIFWAFSFTHFLKFIKQDKLKKARYAKELKEQMMREELGKWK